MTAEDCEELIAAAEQRLTIYRERHERLSQGTSPFYRSLLVQCELHIRTCEERLKELHACLAKVREDPRTLLWAGLLSAPLRLLGTNAVRRHDVK